MNEIRTEQLAFSEEEADCLLNEKLWLDIGLDNLSVLLERTEGWPAGIYLASLSLRMREDKHAFIASFGGSNRYVVDLLGEEVLAGLRKDVRGSPYDFGTRKDDGLPLRRGRGQGGLGHPPA
jgi:LuxR family maltose regulon positive regulatory protein